MQTFNQSSTCLSYSLTTVYRASLAVRKTTAHART